VPFLYMFSPLQDDGLCIVATDKDIILSWSGGMSIVHASTEIKSAPPEELLSIL
jgi:hypothetical protein